MKRAGITSEGTCDPDFLLEALGLFHEAEDEEPSRLHHGFSLSSWCWWLKVTRGQLHTLHSVCMFSSGLIGAHIPAAAGDFSPHQCLFGSSFRRKSDAAAAKFSILHFLHSTA